MFVHSRDCRCVALLGPSSAVTHLVTGGEDALIKYWDLNVRTLRAIPISISISIEISVNAVDEFFPHKAIRIKIGLFSLFEYSNIGKLRSDSRAVRRMLADVLGPHGRGATRGRASEEAPPPQRLLGQHRPVRATPLLRCSPPDARAAALAERRGDAGGRVWNLDSGECVQVLPHQDRVFPVMFLSASLALTGADTGDPRAYLWYCSSFSLYIWILLSLSFLSFASLPVLATRRKR